MDDQLSEAQFTIKDILLLMLESGLSNKFRQVIEYEIVQSEKVIFEIINSLPPSSITTSLSLSSTASADETETELISLFKSYNQLLTSIRSFILKLKDQGPFLRLINNLAYTKTLKQLTQSLRECNLELSNRLNTDSFFQSANNNQTHYINNNGDNRTNTILPSYSNLFSDFSNINAELSLTLRTTSELINQLNFTFFSPKLTKLKLQRSLEDIENDTNTLNSITIDPSLLIATEDSSAIVGFRSKLYKKKLGTSLVVEKVIEVQDGDTEYRQVIAKEVATMKLLSNCQHILKVLGATSYTNRLGIVLEFCSNLSLKQYLSTYPNLKLTTKLKFISGTAAAVHFLHQLKILHKSICTDSILVNAKLEPKLGGFKFSRRSSDGTAVLPDFELDSGINLFRWTPPEKFLGAPSTTQGDIYSLGLVFWSVFTQLIPFAKFKEATTLANYISAGNLEKLELIEGEEQEEWRLLIKELWHINPMNRLNSTQIFERVNHIANSTEMDSEAVNNSQPNSPSASISPEPNTRSTLPTLPKPQPVELKLPTPIPSITKLEKGTKPNLVDFDKLKLTDNYTRFNDKNFNETNVFDYDLNTFNPDLLNNMRTATINFYSVQPNSLGSKSEMQAQQAKKGIYQQSTVNSNGEQRQLQLGLLPNTNRTEKSPNLPEFQESKIWANDANMGKLVTSFFDNNNTNLTKLNSDRKFSVPTTTSSSNLSLNQSLVPSLSLKVKSSQGLKSKSSSCSLSKPSSNLTRILSKLKTRSQEPSFRQLLIDLANKDAEAKYCLANFYAKAQFNFPKDLQLAIKLFTELIETNDPTPLLQGETKLANGTELKGKTAYQLGLIYLDKKHNPGVASLTKAKLWFELAANFHHPAATFNLAICLLNNIGGQTADLQRVESLLERSAELGHDLALKKLVEIRRGK